MNHSPLPPDQADAAIIARRDVLKGAVGLGLLGAASSVGGLASADAAAANPIVRENALPGTRDWMLANTRIDPATRYRCPWIEGYCSATSVAAGETLEIMVSTNPPSAFTIDVYRLGYYGGDGGRHMVRLGPFDGIVQSDPPVGAMRLRECRWTASTTLTIPEDWVSGVYVGKLTEQREGLQSYIIFIVRDDRRADFLFQCSDTTWNAYNRWPNQFALYDNGETEWYLGPGTMTSFNRPYGKYCQVVDSPLSIGSGEFILWEFPMAFWMEQQGYDVSYISNLDTHSNGAGLLRAKAFLSVGHDEYWTRTMYDHVMAAIAAGVHVGFFSADTCWGMIEARPGAHGPHRHITRVDHFGPTDEALVKAYPEVGRFPRKGPDQALMIGARDVYPVSGGGDWICAADDHWIFEGTGMKNGDAIPGLVGWEWHGSPAAIPGLRVVATGKASTGGSEGTYTSTVHEGPKGNIIFNAATIWWGDGLAAPPGYIRPATYTTPRGPDPRVLRITKNILERMRA